MKLSKMKGLSFSLVVAAVLAAGCGAASKQQAIDETQISYRNVPLTDEKDVTPPPVEYTKAAPGQAKKFARSYENAPPMIPHSVEGLVPITRKNNACLGCHMPNVAKSMGATPISPTHFKDFFAATKEKLQKFKGAAKVHSDPNDIAPQRFNCTQCHAPQANAKPLVENTFKPEFRNPENKHKSTLLQNLNEGVK